MLCSLKREKEEKEKNRCYCMCMYNCTYAGKGKKEGKKFGFVCHCSDDTEKTVCMAYLDILFEVGFLLLFVLCGVINRCMSMCFLCDMQVLLSPMSAAVCGEEKHGVGEVHIVNRYIHWTNRSHWCLMYWINFCIV